MKPIHVHLLAKDDTPIDTYYWPAEDTVTIRGIVQIAHGMAEHILRYDDFCNFLGRAGFIVYGNNHRGHGDTAKIKGYFAVENGFDTVASDMKQVTEHIQQTHPGLPIFIFGHSMGSFLTRRYMQLYGTEIAGAIISGTGGDQGLIGKIGLVLARREKRKIGATTPSPKIDKLVFGAYNKKFKPNRTAFDFLSRDEAEVDKYIADDLCGFVCTAGFFVDLIGGIETIHKHTEITRTPVDLPIHFIAGDMDPVGHYGKGVQAAAAKYQQIGCKHVTLTIYPGARHELLNETNKQEVYTDVLTWLNEQIN